MASTTSYRSQQIHQYTDSESSDSGSDDDQPWKRQRTKAKGVPKQSPMKVDYESRSDHVSSLPTEHSATGSKRRRNNVWGTIVQKQTEEEVARDMTGFDMTKSKSKERDVESYNFQRDEYSGKKHLRLGNPMVFNDDDHPRGEKRKMPATLGGSQEDSWLFGEDEEGEEKRDSDRSSVKDRLGSRNDVQSAKERVDIRSKETNMRFIEISEDMHWKEIAGKIAFSLQEPKRDMIKAAVLELGVKKSLELWNETAKVERTGGILINNKSRRRTPGGVYLYLLKMDPDIDEDKKDIVFADGRNQSKKESTKHRRMKRRKGTKMHVDTKDKGNAKMATEGGNPDGEDGYINGSSSDEGSVTAELESEENLLDPGREMAEAAPSFGVFSGVKAGEMDAGTAAGPTVERDQMEEGEITD